MPDPGIIVEADQEQPWVWLRRFRLAMKLTQVEVGDIVGRSQVVISRWETRDGPPPEIARFLFEAMGAPPEVAETFRQAVVRVREREWLSRPSRPRNAAHARTNWEPP